MALYQLLTTLLVIFTGCHGSKAYDQLVYMKDVFQAWNGRSTDTVFKESASSIQNVSDICQQDLMDMFSGDPSLVQVIDSFGKPAPGLLLYNIDWVGNFDECMDITDFRHCLIDMKLNVTVALNSSLTFPVSWGVCAPVSCSKDDVQNSVEFLLDSLNMTWFGVRDVTGSAVHCTEKPVFNGGFIGTCILLGILSLLSLAGTVLDHYITQKQKQRASRGGQSSGQRSTDASKGKERMADTVKEDQNKLGQSSENVSNIEETAVMDCPSAGHPCVDDLGQRSKDKPDLFLSIDGYGATERRGGTNFESKAADSEVVITSGSASETTALLGESVTVVHESKPKNRLWMQFLLCFSMYRTLPMILSSKHAAGSIPCLHGIRVFSILWVILNHTVTMIVPVGLADNLLYYFQHNYTGDFAAQVLVVTAFSVDSFFLLGGLLLSYVTLKKMKEKNGKVGWGWLYLHRYVRLTPVLAVVILLYTFILPSMIQGPISHRYEGRVDLCKAWWWTDLIYINNLVPPGLNQDCISWAWYLANDMQFFILSPLFLIPIYRFGVKGTIVLLITCIASFITTAVLAYQNNFHASPVADIGDINLDEPLFKQPTSYMLATDQSGVIYSKPYCRIPPYLLGIALGYVMHDIGNKKIKLSPVIVAVGWSCATALGITLVYGLYDANRGAVTLSQGADVMYITFTRFAWALTVAWVVFACHYGYGGVVNDFLSWNFWVPMGRLTYATYLVHPLVQFLYAYSLAAPLHWSAITISYLFAAFILLSYCCALVICVLVEFPFGNMEKLLQNIVQGKK